MPLPKLPFVMISTLHKNIFLSSESFYTYYNFLEEKIMSSLLRRYMSLLIRRCFTCLSYISTINILEDKCPDIELL